MQELPAPSLPTGKLTIPIKTRGGNECVFYRNRWIIAALAAVLVIGLANVAGAKSLITGKDIANGTITSKDVKNLCPLAPDDFDKNSQSTFAKIGV